MRLLIDSSAILRQFMYLKDEEFGEDYDTDDGKTVHVPHLDTCKERFKGSLQKILEDLDASPPDIIWVLEEGSCMTRVAILPEYKAQRKKRIYPPEFWKTYKKFKDWATEYLHSLGAISVISRDDHEADDVINELSRRLIDKTVIVSTDKDLLACPADIHYIGHEIIDFQDYFPVPERHQIPIYRAVVTGDSSDNIPSCKGFGPKAWEKMIKIFGPESVQALTELILEQRLDDLKEDVEQLPKLQLLIDQADTVYKAYDVMSFLPVPANRLKWRSGLWTEAFMDWEPTATLVTADNFDEVFMELSMTAADYAVIDFETDVPPESIAWLQKIADTDDMDKIGVDVIASEICGMGLRVNEKAWYFCVDHRDTSNIELKQLGKVINLIDGTRVIAHNSTGFENIMLYKHFGKFLPDMVDTRLMASYVDENDYVNLKHLSKRWLGYKQETYSQTLKRAGASGMREVSGEEVVSYGIDDVVVTDSLYNLFSVILQYEKTLDIFYKVEQDAAYFTSMCFFLGTHFNKDAFEKLQKRNKEKRVKVWKELREELIAINWPGSTFEPLKVLSGKRVKEAFKLIYGRVLDTKVRKWEKLIEAVRKQGGIELANAMSMPTKEKRLEAINALMKKHWEPNPKLNVRSAPQMVKLLYDKKYLGCEVRITNKLTDKMRKDGRKEGNPSADELAIRNAIAFKDTDRLKLLHLLIEYKATLTLDSLFYEKYPNFVHWKTGKLHCSMMQSSTTTRRFSHSKPNLAQLPKKKGKENRSMLKAPGPDWSIAKFDFDSQELKLGAWATQDTIWLSCYTGPKEERKDVHSMTGYNVAIQMLKNGKWQDYDEFKAEIDAGSPEDDEEYAGWFRQTGKTINFATQYLCRETTLAHQLCTTEKNAVLFMKAKSAAFPTVDTAVRKYIAKCEERGYSLTFLGARRHLHGHKHFGSRDTFIQEAAGRLAWSFRIQGSAAEQTKLAMGRCYREGLLHPAICRPITTIHDELVFAIRNTYLDLLIPKLVKAITAQYDGMELENTTTPEVGPDFGTCKPWKKVA